MSTTPDIMAEQFTLPQRTISEIPINGVAKATSSVVIEELPDNYTENKESIIEEIKEHIEDCSSQIQFLQELLNLHRELFGTLSQPSISSQTKMVLTQKITIFDKDVQAQLNDLNTDMQMALEDLQLASK